MRTRPRTLTAAATGLGVLALGLGIVIFGPIEPAFAACHSFTVTVSPATVTEGAAVTVTVSRDGAVAPSHIDVETVDGSAKAGSDYTAVARRTVSFTNDTTQSFPVQTTDDTTDEPNETFRLHLSNPGGCSVNPNFVVGPDAQATIADNDAPVATTTPTTVPTTSRSTTTRAPSTTAASTTATSQSPDSSTSSSSTSVASSSTSSTADLTPTTAGAPGDGDSGGSSAGLVVAVAVVVLALGAGGWWVWRRRAASA